MKRLNYISRVVRIGHLPMGGNYPVRIQSMTNTNTLNTKATVDQSIRMIEAGCEYVRITAQGVREAENLFEIKKELKRQGYHTPLIADIHYNPKVAEIAAGFVEKVRINPGNYIDRKKGKLSYSDSEYATEIDHIRERIKPLILICRQHGTAIRIGTNNGSLSERIMLKYGDTPVGMVESALEFVRICAELDFHHIVLSMKASNVKVMVQANRLLVKRMIEEGMNYPVHLGVTEAGDGEDGRIKSAAGIGTLLEEGIGDTIRISLTEDPEFEIPVAKEIVSRYSGHDERRLIIRDITDPVQYQRRSTHQVQNFGKSQVPVVIADKSLLPSDFQASEITSIPDYFYDHEKDYLIRPVFNGELRFIPITGINLKFISSPGELQNLKAALDSFSILILNFFPNQSLQELRDMIHLMNKKHIRQPVVLRCNYEHISEDRFLIHSAIDFSFLLIDGLIDGIWLHHQELNYDKVCGTAFGVLQATGSRISKTEYIACPSCGRTLFNIQETLKKIKSRTLHLTGLKIGVMGCCVNGPGEMADADYGYVGAGYGKISLYRGRKIVKAGIPESEAVDALISLIKSNGDWK